MTRYIIRVGDRWVTSLYDMTSNGIGLTDNKEDASSWSYYETAQEKVLLLREIFSFPIVIEAREEPDYPRSWDLEPHAA
ncbi:MAG: hypothetical protein ACO29V_05630 [Limnohabitans sp.]